MGDKWMEMYVHDEVMCSHTTIIISMGPTNAHIRPFSTDSQHLYTVMNYTLYW